MPANIEVKAALHNRATALATAARLADSGPETFHQEDVFFRCDGARLKLRIFDPSHGELIRYQRETIPGARCSRYSIASTTDPQILLDILTKTLGVIGSVKKTRTLYLAGQTRIHIDQVEGLGDFLELEVVLRPGQSESEGREIASGFLRVFGIGQQQLIGEAYIDLLACQSDRRS
jgi:predicted adenylyl cyclase CyaB